MQYVFYLQMLSIFACVGFTSAEAVVISAEHFGYRRQARNSYLFTRAIIFSASVVWWLIGSKNQPYLARKTNLLFTHRILVIFNYPQFRTSRSTRRCMGVCHRRKPTKCLCYRSGRTPQEEEVGLVQECVWLQTPSGLKFRLTGKSPCCRAQCNVLG